MSVFLRTCSLLCLLLLVGCSQPVELLTQNISNKAWLLTPLPQVGAEGFFLHPNGSVLMLAEGEDKSGRWFLEGNSLHLADAETMSPVMVDEKVCLESSSVDDSLVFCSVDLSQLKSGHKYFPTFLGNLTDYTHKPFVQFDVSEGVVRGFGGVNNFRGKFTREDLLSVDFGPIMSTRMAGPGMDDEFRLIQCLDRSDGMLVLRERLYLYEGSTFLCSFVPESK